MNIQPRIYLASQSLRRRELLKQIAVNFEMLLPRFDPRRGADTDETPLAGESAETYVQRVCQEKANAGWRALQFRNLPLFPVLAADTTVILDGQIFGKPQDRAQAGDMLRALSGRQHQVLTAVAVIHDGRLETRLSASKVTFAPLGEDRIRHYLLTNEPMDKAGAYAIQGYAAAFIQHVEGSYSGVMGLPLFETSELLQIFGYPVL